MLNTVSAGFQVGSHLLQARGGGRGVGGSGVRGPGRGGAGGGGGGEGRESIAFQSDWQISECLSGLRRQRLEFPDSCCSGPGTEARK